MLLTQLATIELLDQDLRFHHQQQFQHVGVADSPMYVDSGRFSYMASRVVTQLISDLSGNDIEDGGGETIAFSYRGTSYTIDLTSKEAAGFDKSIASYLEHASKVGGSRRGSTTKTASKGDAKAIREWAQGQGIDVPARGRIPAELRVQYDAAH